MDPVYSAIEATGFSIWLRESPSLWAFPFVLILHTVGLAFAVGATVTMAARVLGLARSVPPGSLHRFALVLWLGFWLNAASGAALLIAYPTKQLTNPLFYVKLGLIAGGVLAARRLTRYVAAARRAAPSVRSDGTAAYGEAPAPVRMAAIVSLVCWAASIFAGRLLAYTYARLTVDFAG